MISRLLLCVFFLGQSAGALWAGEGAKVQGQVVIYKTDAKGKKKPIKGWDVSNTVVYLVPAGQTALSLPVPEIHPSMSQKNALFQPPVLAIAQNQTVDFPNDDNIHHNVFSFSNTRKFDLGIYPKGTRHSVKFQKLGPVIIYCSIHEKMNAVVYVAPNSLNAVTDDRGKFSIEAVPPGKYAVRTWHRMLPESEDFVEVTTVHVEKKETVRVEINLADLMKNK